jgi:hypothetical protein
MSDIIRERVERDLAGLRRLPRVPKVSAILLAEGEHAARFCELHYEPTVEAGRALPGLRGARLPHDTPAVIYFLIQELERTRGEAASGGVRDFPVARVREIRHDLRSLLRWEADEDPALAARLGVLDRTHRRATGRERAVVALAEYVQVARANEAQLRTLGAFDPALLDEAEALIAAWRARPALERQPAEVRRAGLSALLRQRIRRVVAAADLVFRHHPDVAARARSERQRRARAEAARTRRARRDAASRTPSGPATPTEEPTA